MVDQVLTSPLSMRTLDPACGSGTFLFHSVRKYIAEAERKGTSLVETLIGVTRNVIGMDLHPVAVTLARVTYLLAIGKARLTNPNRGTIQIPVYLGDSIQWRQQVDLWTAGNLVIRTEDNRELFSSELRFPDAFLENAALFDQLVSDLATKASKRKKGSKAPSLSSTFQRLGISSTFQPVIEATFAAMCRLHDEDRDHIWAYYIRNLARPMWLAREPNRVDVLIGNPPWLAYRHMTADMQTTFRDMSQARGLWAGAEVATQQDLSALFVARAIQLYLKANGTFAFVMPNAVVDRVHYAGFRTGSYDERNEELRLKFGTPWDLRRIRPHIFPRGSAVVFGERSAIAEPMKKDVVRWTGHLPRGGNSWQEVADSLTTAEGTVSRISAAAYSLYRDRFSNGATVFPRVLFFVKPQAQSPLGVPAGRMRIESARSNNEKAPWKRVETLTGVVETEFVRPVIVSECLLHYRITEPARAVIPWDGAKLLVAENDIEMYPGLADWWQQASQTWESKRANSKLPLVKQLDYMSKLSKQFPASEMRLVYNKSGMHVVAAKVLDRRAVIENGLYWATVNSEAEADYLCAILNAPATTELARPFMSYGKDERDIEKHIWQLPIPEFDGNDETHRTLVRLGRDAQRLAEQVTFDGNLHFAAKRRRIRDALEKTPVTKQVNEIIFELLS